MNTIKTNVLLSQKKCISSVTHLFSLSLRIFFHLLISMNPEKYVLYRDQNWNIIDDLQ